MTKLIAFGVALQLCIGATAAAQWQPCSPCCQKPSCAPTAQPAQRWLEALPDEPMTAMQESLRRDLWWTVAAGVFLVGVGEAITIGHYASTKTEFGLLDFVPVLGPGVVAYRYGIDDGWTSALILSSWLQAAGVILAATAGAALADMPVKVGASAGRDGASLELRARF
jgi:hypothetical protein